MNPEEYQKLADIEARHWFYLGKRLIVRHWINRFHPLNQTDLLVDAGAGTGIFAAEMCSLCRVEAVDDHEESLVLARQKLGAERVKQGTCIQLPYGDSSVDVLTALDVIEHVENDHAAVAEFRRVLKPGGVAVITVPALPALWSDWDVALHHFRRYTRRSLGEVVAAGDFEVLHLAYVNVAVLPIVFAVRKWRAFRLKSGKRKAESENNQTMARSEDVVPSSLLNKLLLSLFVRLACQSAISFPAGVGLIAVLRKRP